jgi:hypothetical protein
MGLRSGGRRQGVGEERSLDVLGEGVKGQAIIAPRVSGLNLNHLRREELKVGAL